MTDTLSTPAPPLLKAHARIYIVARLEWVKKKTKKKVREMIRESTPSVTIQTER